MERNEAIEVVRKNWPEGRHQLSEALKTLIPELKESEDERIRKEAISIIRQYNNICDKEGDKCRTADRVIAWLEKQCEQKQPTKYTLEQAARIFLDALSDTPYNNKPVTDAQVITRELLKFLSDARSYNPDALNELNPAWSKEDEDMEDNIFKAIQHLLKQNDSWGFLEECLDWLKSLKSRYTWKPSDEQMEYLAKAITTLGNEGDNKTSAILCELRTDLKKLTE